jgi:putative SOS response-associated peptidase YedK
VCNRFSRDVEITDVWKRFQVEHIFEHGLNSNQALQKPSYNIAPDDFAVTVFAPEKSRCLNVMTFGLVPSWCYGQRISSRFMNARAETITDKEAFKDLLPRKRCLIPATGFYEWRAEDGRKQPYHFRFKDGRLFAFAGLWNTWRSSDPTANESYSFAIITTTPNELCASIHDRMPVILDEKAEKRWLDPDEKDPGKLVSLLKPLAADEMECFRVTPQMNNSRFNEKRCVERWDGRDSQPTIFSNSRGS